MAKHLIQIQVSEILHERITRAVDRHNARTALRLSRSAWAEAILAAAATREMNGDYDNDDDT